MNPLPNRSPPKTLTSKFEEAQGNSIDTSPLSLQGRPHPRKNPACSLSSSTARQSIVIVLVFFIGTSFLSLLLTLASLCCFSQLSIFLFSEEADREFGLGKDGDDVAEIESLCEVGLSGKMFLFTDLLGDPICQICQSSPISCWCDFYSRVDSRCHFRLIALVIPEENMECNKDEAIRAKEISLRKFTERDFNGAKKFASKAMHLFPDLEGISQFLMILDVHISAENKVNGQMDWYGILGASFLDNEDTIKKHYRKLALHLHPDKNKLPGADVAFQFVLDAYGALSDKVKKSAYDQKLNVRPAQGRVPARTGVSVVPPASSQFQPRFPAKDKMFAPSAKANLFQKVVPDNGGHQRHQKTSTGFSAQPPKPRVPAQTGGVSVAPNANSQFQPKFPAKDKMPSTEAKTKGVADNGGQRRCQKTSTGLQAQSPSKNGHHESSSPAAYGAKLQGGSSSQKGEGPSPIPASPPERNSFWTSCDRCKMQYEYLRKFLNKTLLCPHCHKAFKAVEIPPPSNISPLPKWHPQQQQQQHQEPQPSASTHGWKDLNSINHLNGHSGPGSSSSAFAQATDTGRRVNQKVKRNNVKFSEGGSSLKRRMVQDENVSWSTFSRFPNPFVVVNRDAGGGGMQSNYFAGSSSSSSVNRELSQVETRDMLMHKASVEVGITLSDGKLENKARAAAKENRKKENQKQRFVETVGNLDFTEPSDESLSNKSSFDTCAAVTEQVPRTVSINVPDSDFHDFDADRTELCFQNNDVWAAYDTDDGMPRFYALVHEVISLKPFKMRISWLNSKSNIEFGPVEWISNGFTKTCGEFRVGKHELNESLNSFSHKVKWVKGPRGVIQIYPAKGDVWTLYKNWSADWDDETPEDVRHGYEMVEVIESYSKDEGVMVAPLVKAPGFRTVFKRQLDNRNPKRRRIPKEEMFRFSHQVPSQFLTADHSPGAPEGCIELDPASTPAEFLEVGEQVG